MSSHDILSIDAWDARVSDLIDRLADGDDSAEDELAALAELAATYAAEAEVAP